MFLFSVNEPVNPCVPSPCGPNSQCREINAHAVCSCKPNYIGMPPSCRPECVTSSECPQDKACVREKCFDPCPGTCGVNARCQVLNHNPICSCSPGYTGDPFIQCQVEPSEILPKILFSDFLQVCMPCNFRSHRRYSYRKSLRSLTLWPLLFLSKCWKSCCMFLFT
jgi:hypothetical protein